VFQRRPRLHASYQVVAQQVGPQFLPQHLRRLARQVFHFHRLFTRIYRSTPHRYLTQKRIEKAKQLLAENKAINDVCCEVGFESLGSFSTLFKKEIGFAPTFYRNIAWLKKQEQKKQPKKFIPHCFIESYALDK